MDKVFVKILVGIDYAAMITMLILAAISIRNVLKRRKKNGPL
jgi:hypothetical protein